LSPYIAISPVGNERASVQFLGSPLGVLQSNVLGGNSAVRFATDRIRLTLSITREYRFLRAVLQRGAFGGKQKQN
jgi:hypothetical protein